MTDHAIQRLNMVESQVRPSDVTDRRIVRAMRELPREQFVPALQKSIAYADSHIRVADAGGVQRHILAPRLLARMVQLLAVESDGIILDIGPATGYSTALIAKLAETVIGLEVDPVLADRAEATLAALGIDHAVIVCGPLAAGLASEGPYDGILLNGLTEVVPPQLLDQLKDGGRLVTVSIVDGVGRAVVWRRHGIGFDREVAFDAMAPALPGFARETGFVF